MVVVLLAVWAVANAAPFIIGPFGWPEFGVDWRTSYAEVGSRVADGSLYESAQQFWRYSPVAAWLLGPVAVVGAIIWTLPHLVALGSLWWVDRRLFWLAGLSFPFWMDLWTGNLLTYAFVLAVWALRGQRWATVGYLAMLLLMPRPVQIPAAIWLLWRQPDVRWPFVGMALVHTALVLWSGYAGAWLEVLLYSAPLESAAAYNFSPSAWIGYPWFGIGLVLGLWLTWRGRLGLASLVIAPYLLPQYFLMGLLEVRSRDAPDGRQIARGPSPAGT